MGDGRGCAAGDACRDVCADGGTALGWAGCSSAGFSSTGCCCTDRSSAGKDASSGKCCGCECRPGAGGGAGPAGRGGERGRDSGERCGRGAAVRAGSGLPPLSSVFPGGGAWKGDKPGAGFCERGAGGRGGSVG